MPTLTAPPSPPENLAQVLDRQRADRDAGDRAELDRLASLEADRVQQLHAQQLALAEAGAHAQRAYQERQRDLVVLNAAVTDAASIAMAKAKAALEGGDLELAIELSTRAVAANNLLPIVVELRKVPPGRPDPSAVAARASS